MLPRVRSTHRPGVAAIALGLGAALSLVLLVAALLAIRPATDEYTYAAAAHLDGFLPAFGWFVTNWYPFMGVYALEMATSAVVPRADVAFPIAAAVGVLLLWWAGTSLVRFVSRPVPRWQTWCGGLVVSSVVVGALGLSGFGGAPAVWLLQPYAGLRAAPLLLAIAVTPWLLERGRVSWTVAAGAVIAGAACAIWTPAEGIAVGLWWLVLGGLRRWWAHRPSGALAVAGATSLVLTLLVLASPGGRSRQDFEQETLKQTVYDVFLSLQQTWQSVSSLRFALVVLGAGFALGWLLRAAPRRSLAALGGLALLAGIHLALHSISEAKVYIGPWHLPPVSLMAALLLLAIGGLAGGWLRHRIHEESAARVAVSLLTAVGIVVVPLTLVPTVAALQWRADAWAARSQQSLQGERDYTTIRLRAPDGTDMAPDLLDRTQSIHYKGDYGPGFMEWAYENLPLGY